MDKPPQTTFKEIKSVHPVPGVGGDYPRPENTPGVFIEHFDLSWPIGDGRDGIVYRHLYETAKEATAREGWTFRSYSDVATPGTRADWVARQIRHFPTLILYRDGVELGRHTAIINTLQGILCWAKKLLGIEGVPPIPPDATSGFTLSNSRKTMSDDFEPDMTPLREELERHFVSGTPLEVIYFGGGMPGARRTITPFRYCEERGSNYLIALCHRSGIEKTFRLDRMHLPGPPVANGKNDFRTISKCLNKPGFIESMLSQIASLGNLPMEQALARHLEQHGEFESFFDEYPYGSYTLELTFKSAVIYLSLGYEANDCDVMHYEFTPENKPRLTPGIATHYSLYLGNP